MQKDRKPNKEKHNIFITATGEVIKNHTRQKLQREQKHGQSKNTGQPRAEI